MDAPPPLDKGIPDPSRQSLARALSNYLSISRNADRYAAERAYLAAEAAAWDRLQQALGEANR